MKIAYIAHIALAAGLSATALAASAAVNDLGSGSFSATVEKSERGFFTDVFNFSYLPGTNLGTVSGSLVEVQSPVSGGIDWGDVAAIRIFGGADATGPTLFVQSGPPDPTQRIDFSHIAVPSLFSVAISGRPTGSGGDSVPPVFGTYRLDLVTQAVPEPQTWALLFAGLGVLGVAARRRAAAR
jgi:PEP-CTERM motif